jgi:hypothetical protein
MFAQVGVLFVFIHQPDGQTIEINCEEFAKQLRQGCRELNTGFAKRAARERDAGVRR